MRRFSTPKKEMGFSEETNAFSTRVTGRRKDCGTPKKNLRSRVYGFTVSINNPYAFDWRRRIAAACEALKWRKIGFLL
jgi:hypothetical protein